MRLRIFKSKIHRATVTHADLDYEGSVTIDRQLMKLGRIVPYEEVHIWNVTRGTRLSTYALPGPDGSGVVCVNGAAAHHNRPGDLVILATFAEMDPAEAEAFEPTVLRVDASNHPLAEQAPELPGPLRSAGRGMASSGMATPVTLGPGTLD